MSEMTEKALTIIEPRMSVSIATDETFNTLFRYAKVAASAKRLSKLPDEAETMFVILAGFEYGFSPMQAIRNIYIVNGKPTVSGQMLLAMINKSGLADIIEIPTTEEILEQGGATVRMKRKDRDQIYSATFTHEMGKTAKLATKDNWQNYWWRMCLWRAVSHCASIAFPDVVEGMYTVEEINPDIPVDEAGAPVDPISVSFASHEPQPIVQPAPEMVVVSEGAAGKWALKVDETSEPSTVEASTINADAAFNAIPRTAAEMEQPALGLVEPPAHPKNKRTWDVGKVANYVKFKAKYIDVEKEGEAGAEAHFVNLITRLESNLHITDTSSTDEVIKTIDEHYAAKTESQTKKRKLA